MKTFTSDLSGKTFPVTQIVHANAIRSAILDMMRKNTPGPIEVISMSELADYRQRYIESSLKAELDTLTSLEKEVLEKMKRHELVSDNIEAEWSKHYTLGQRVADKVAAFGGSWRFIIIFCSFIGLWITVNIIALFSKNFDPYPFILLNLMLSCLAALQAPVIMMSQNRSEEKDRERAREDYKVNLKSEIEIQALHEKIDHLIINQQGRLFEIQNIQVEMLREILDEISVSGAAKPRTKKPTSPSTTGQ